MIPSDLFHLLDLDGDGALSREEVHAAARELGWHWREAPLYAVLDNLTIREPLKEADFSARLEEIVTDPHGPYGRVLLHSPVFQTPASPSESSAETDSAFLIIDPQRSFTEGAWMRSIGAPGHREVEPLRQAFSRCGEFLRLLPAESEVLFTRCPFPPESYDWDERIRAVIPEDQLYFVKPGNSALWPPTNGFHRWVTGLAARGFSTLVIGGCTLNSCVRVTAMEIQTLLCPRDLQVVVDLSLCGARAANSVPSSTFRGISPVDSAIQQMRSVGVRVRVG